MEGPSDAGNKLDGICRNRGGHSNRLDFMCIKFYNFYEVFYIMLLLFLETPSIGNCVTLCVPFSLSPVPVDPARTLLYGQRRHPTGELWTRRTMNATLWPNE